MKAAMRKLCVAVLAMFVFLCLGISSRSQESWSSRLTGEGDIQSFVRPSSRLWLQQQGLVFLSPQRLAVYQVNRTLKPAPLSARTASGGAGNFVLVLKVFDTVNGHKIKQMRFVTTADYSAILPTHDGNFIVRAGNIIGLFSPDFSLRQSRTLPLERHAKQDDWQIHVTPSGTQVAIGHQQRFLDSSTLETALDSHSQFDLEMLDSDTLKTVRTLHLPYYMATWLAQEHFLVATTPNRPLEDAKFGTMDFEGHWSPLQRPWMEKHPCHYRVHLLDHDMLAGYGCGHLALFSQDGKEIWTLSEISGRSFVSIASAGHFLAIEIGRIEGLLNNDDYMLPEELRVYDLQSRQPVLSVNLNRAAVKYGISPDGLLAVVQGDLLKLYRPEGDGKRP